MTGFWQVSLKIPWDKAGPYTRPGWPRRFCAGLGGRIWRLGKELLRDGHSVVQPLVGLDPRSFQLANPDKGLLADWIDDFDEVGHCFSIDGTDAKSMWPLATKMKRFTKCFTIVCYSNDRFLKKASIKNFQFWLKAATVEICKCRNVSK